MCTASWLIHGDGFELFFNRDESVRRGPAEAPRRARWGGVEVLAPRDSDAGGTWIGANAHGLVLGLLNGREFGPAAGAPRSRGLLVQELLDAAEPAEVWERLTRSSLAPYRAFSLLVLAPSCGPRVAVWDGTRLGANDPVLPLCSSSLDGGRAQLECAAVFGRSVTARRPTREELVRFHASHEPTRGPWSPCMHRAEARTVSATEVRVGSERVSMRYAPGAPCETPYGPWIELERVP